MKKNLLNKFNKGIASSWGHCSIYAESTQNTKTIGFRFPNEHLQKDSAIIQVGLHSCHDNKKHIQWCENCQGNALIIEELSN